jgi:hypothetical protein
VLGLRRTVLTREDAVKGALVIVAAAVGGVLLAGVASAVLIPALPPALRGAPLVWATTAVVVALAVLAAFKLTGSNGD